VSTFQINARLFCVHPETICSFWDKKKQTTVKPVSRGQLWDKEKVVF